MFRPVNEKLAIQRLTGGLRNGRLSTILPADDYSELKDVIRAAKDPIIIGRIKVPVRRLRQSLPLNIEQSIINIIEDKAEIVLIFRIVVLGQTHHNLQGIRYHRAAALRPAPRRAHEAVA